MQENHIKKRKYAENLEMIGLLMQENECPRMWTVGMLVTIGETVRSSLWAHLPQCTGRLGIFCTACVSSVYILAFCSVEHLAVRFLWASD